MIRNPEPLFWGITKDSKNMYIRLVRDHFGEYHLQRQQRGNTRWIDDDPEVWQDIEPALEKLIEYATSISAVHTTYRPLKMPYTPTDLLERAEAGTSGMTLDEIAGEQL